MEKIMKEKYLRFVECLLDDDSPFCGYRVEVRRGLFDIILTTGSTINPSDLEWLKLHLDGVRWFITSENGRVQIVVRFDDDE